MHIFNNDPTGMLDRVDFLNQLQSMNIDAVTKMINKEKIIYANVPAGFDIEVSSFRTEQDEKRACMYIWQFGINGLVTYGRTWKEFTNFMTVLEEVLGLSYWYRLPIYVHNLQYEFQFIRKHFNWDKVFLLEDRKPAQALTGGFEFRDSLVLAGGVSLDTVGKNLTKYPVRKLVGNLDYNIVHGPETPLTEYELAYCENDIRVIMSYIQEKIETDGNVAKIPMTNTGYVRNYCREAMFPSQRED